MEQEEYIVDGHKVTHSVHLGDREIFLAVQQDAPLPFYVGYMCQRRFEIVRKRRRNFVIFRRGG